MTSSFEQYSDGKNLFGDYFSSDQIESWFRDEAETYYNLPEEREPGLYAYHARNWRHGFRHLPSRSFEHVLCLGGAYDDELRPILGRAERVTILEPADGFHNPKFEYVKPDATGHMALPIILSTSLLVLGYCITFQTFRPLFPKWRGTPSLWDGN